MNILRRLGIWALYSLFFTSLFFIAYGVTFNETIGKRTIVKSWLENSGIYSNFVDEVVSLSQSQAAEQQNVIDGRILTKAANEAFPPEFLQSSLESVLDGGYDWFREVEPRIEFRLDFTESKTLFADNISQSAAGTIRSLPSCSPQKAAAIAGGGFDPFSATCVPEGLDTAPLISELQQQILQDDGIFAGPIITDANLTINSGDATQRIDDALPQIPTIFSFTRYIPFVAVITATIGSIGLIVVSKSKLKALFTVFRGVAFATLSLLFFTVISSRSTAWIDELLADPNTTGFTQRIVYPFVDVAVVDITRWLTYFIIGYGILAAVLLITYLVIRHAVKSKSRVNEHPSPPMAIE